jgi:hypothetical protein
MSWTNRWPGQPSGRRHGAIDSRESARIAQSLRESIAHYGLSPNPSSPLARMLVAADRFAAEEDPRDDGGEAVRLIGQAQRLALNLSDFRAVNDPSRVVGCVQGQIDRLAKPTSHALDFLFEIQMASAFARHDMLSVSSGDPDVVVKGPGGAAPVILECKHPDTLKGVKRRILEGQKQIDERKGFGVVVVCIDTVIQPHGKALRMRTYEDAQKRACAEVEGMATTCSWEISKACDASPLMLGVMFVTWLAFVTDEPDRIFAYQFAAHVRGNQHNAEAEGLLSTLMYIAFDEGPVTPVDEGERGSAALGSTSRPSV